MSRLDDLYKRPGFLLRRAHQIAVTLFLNELEDKAVTTTQYGVLMILRHCEGLDQIDLSKKVGWTAPPLRWWCASWSRRGWPSASPIPTMAGATSSCSRAVASGRWNG